MTTRQLSDLQVIGDTDRLHAADDYQAPSGRHAEAVRDGLVAGGIAAHTIQFEGRGADDRWCSVPGPPRQRSSTAWRLIDAWKSAA